jgi:hypothetical protein
MDVTIIGHFLYSRTPESGFIFGGLNNQLHYMRLSHDWSSLPLITVKQDKPATFLARLGRYWIAASDGRNVAIYDISSGDSMTLLQSIRVPRPIHSINVLCMPDHQFEAFPHHIVDQHLPGNDTRWPLVVVGGENGMVAVVHPFSGQLLWCVEKAHAEAVICVEPLSASYNTGRRFMTRSIDGGIALHHEIGYTPASSDGKRLPSTTGVFRTERSLSCEATHQLNITAIDDDRVAINLPGKYFVALPTVPPAALHFKW